LLQSIGSKLLFAFDTQQLESWMFIGQDYLLSLVDQRVKDIIFQKYKNSPREDVINCLTELMKYLYLVSKHPKMLAGTFVPITQEVDELWHQMILQTRYYPQICERLPGKRLVHHESMPFEDYVSEHEDQNKLVHEILRWVPYYVKTFGDIQPSAIRYWCFFGSVLEVQNLGLDKLNEIARNDSYFKMESDEEDFVRATNTTEGVSHGAVEIQP
jgi:hypothetical protein